MAKKQIKKIRKVNKEAFQTDAAPKIDNDEQYRCSCCGHKYKRQEGYFNVSKSPIYKGNNGYMTICKRCMSLLYEQYVLFFDRDEDAAAERICQITDMFFDENAWAASRKPTTQSSTNNRIGAYISKLNLNQTKGSTYSDTLVRMWEQQEAEDAGEPEEDEIPLELITRFGFGFAKEEYDALNYEYNNWCERCGEPLDKRQEELYVSICYLKLNLQKNIRNDASTGIGALAKSYKDFIEAATTEIEDRKKKAEADKILPPIGMLYKDIETYCPAEFYKDKKIYSDPDGIGNYLSRFFLRPISNLLTGSKELDQEFNLSDSEE